MLNNIDEVRVKALGLSASVVTAGSLGADCAAGNSARRSSDQETRLHEALRRAV